MVEINHLQKVDDILNSEGTILGLFREKSGKLYLSSYLKDGSGEIFYSTDARTLKKYFNSEIILGQVYLDSDDFIITRKNRTKTESFIKIDFIELIQCSDKLFSELSISMRNDKLVDNFYGS